MSQDQLSHHQRYLVEEFAEAYLENRLSRRELLHRSLLITGSISLTALTLTALGCGSGPDNEEAVSASPTASRSPTSMPAGDTTVRGEDISFAGPASPLLGYLARPATGGPFPAIVLIHENRGLLEHFKDVARRYAKEGFAALAVDLISRGGGTDAAAASGNTGFLGRASTQDLSADLLAYVSYLKTQPFVRPAALGVSGFCFGGTFTWELATQSPDIKAAVPYYGSIRALDDLTKTQAAILAIYGGNDTRITGQGPQVEERLKAANKTYQIKIYEGANHAFFNDTGGAYNAAAAADAWQLTLAWSRRHLSG